MFVRLGLSLLSFGLISSWCRIFEIWKWK